MRKYYFEPLAGGYRDPALYQVPADHVHSSVPTWIFLEELVHLSGLDSPEMMMAKTALRIMGGLVVNRTGDPVRDLLAACHVNQDEEGRWYRWDHMYMTRSETSVSYRDYFQPGDEFIAWLEDKGVSLMRANAEGETWTQ